MTYKIKRANIFKRDLKTMQKRGYPIIKLKDTITLITKGMPLDKRYNDHKLSGNYNGYRECHIMPDWLLIYRLVKKENLVELARTGTHADLFKM